MKSIEEHEAAKVSHQRPLSCLGVQLRTVNPVDANPGTRHGTRHDSAPDGEPL